MAQTPKRPRDANQLAKLIVSWLVGSRDAETALDFMHDLRSRLRNRVQLTSDGLVNYLVAVENAFGDDVDYEIQECPQPLNRILYRWCHGCLSQRELYR